MRIKICGITNFSDAEMATKYGADALGFLLGIRHRSEDVISVDKAKTIIRKLPPFVTTVMVTHLLDAKSICELHKEVKTHVIQLHDDIPSSEILILRKALPEVKLLKAVHVTGPEALQKARLYEAIVDGIVLDTINLAEDRIGGTGITHDWRISAKIREAISKPVILAGGLNPENVSEAIRIVRPYGVDVNTGVKKDRYSNRKDPDKLKKFILTAKKEFIKLQRKER